MRLHFILNLTKQTVLNLNPFRKPTYFPRKPIMTVELRRVKYKDNETM